MSRIGNQPITVPDSVEVTINDCNIKIKGSKGELEYNFSPLVDVVLQDKEINFWIYI